MSAWRLHVVLKCVTPWSLYNGSVTCQNCLMLYNTGTKHVQVFGTKVAGFGCWIPARKDVDLHTYMSKITCDTVADCSANQRSADAPPELVSVLGQWVRAWLYPHLAYCSINSPNRANIDRIVICRYISMLCQQNCHKNWSRIPFVGKVNSCFRSIKDLLLSKLFEVNSLNSVGPPPTILLTYKAEISIGPGARIQIIFR